MMQLSNPIWLRENETKLKELLPETWTHVSNLNTLSVGLNLKLLGIDWRSDTEFGKVMVYLEKIGIMLRDGVLVKRNPHSIF